MCFAQVAGFGKAFGMRVLIWSRDKARKQAAIDVYEEEPVYDASDPLLQLDNVICTPHLGYVERDQLGRYFSDQFSRVLAYANGKPYGIVNPAALKDGTPVRS